MVRRFSYNAKEKQIIHDHINKEYGAATKIIYLSENQRDVPIDYDLLVIYKKDMVILMTFGLGSYVSHNHDEHTNERTEIFMELPANWDYNDPKQRWPIHFIISIAKYSYYNHLTLKWQQVFVNNDYFNESDKIAGILDLSWYDNNSLQCEVNNEFVVSFYQIMIITDSELLYSHKNGAHKLMNYFDDGKARIVDLNRKSLI